MYKYNTCFFDTVPAKPNGIKEDTTVRTTDKVGVTWSAPSDGGHDGYDITISGQSGTIHLGKDVTSNTFNNIKAGNTYTVTLKTTLGNLSSAEVTQQVTASKC